MSRPILEVLSHLKNGTLLSEAGDELAALVLAVDETGKPGKLTIEVSLRKATAGSMALTGKVAVRKPAEVNYESLMFPTVDGNLLTDDPRQQKLELSAVSAAKPVVLEKVSG